MDEYWTPSAGQSEFNYLYSGSNSLGFDVGSSDPIQTILDVANKNNQWSASQAALQRDWQEVQNQKAMDFNSAEAQKNRDWQKMMSDTAHQREILDLQRAGLNPVLSATGGNGASVTSGATASGVTSSGAKGDTDESTTSAVMSWMANMLSAQTAILNTSVSAQAGMANASMMAGAQSYAAQLAYDAQMSSTDKVAGSLLREGIQALGGTGTINSGLRKAGETAQKLGQSIKSAITNPSTDWLGSFAHWVGKAGDKIKSWFKK